MRTLAISALIIGVVGVAAAQAQIVVPAATVGNPKVYAAVINDNGKFMRGTTGVKGKHIGTGEYNVTFPVNVSKCVFVATVGSATTVPEFGAGWKVASVPGNTKGVYVAFFNNGAFEDRSFHIVVACP